MTERLNHSFSKRNERERIARATAAWLAAGGKIRQCSPGETGRRLPSFQNRQQRKDPGACG